MLPQGGAEGLAGQNDPAWALPLGAVVLGVRHMGLSGWQVAECMAIENELTAWQEQGDFKAHEPALRYSTCICLFVAVAPTLNNTYIQVRAGRLQGLSTWPNRITFTCLVIAAAVLCMLYHADSLAKAG